MREFLGIELAGQHGEIGVEGLGVPLAVVWGGVAGSPASEAAPSTPHNRCHSVSSATATLTHEPSAHG